ncbi:hypothetical protein QQX98_009254 [Neonectria punicea]|uniref:F-box domain-containing protein n=1 Tax=Neonectria punicea TaxID=979145 RepID=A0ABR1GT27_9HYPO
MADADTAMTDSNTASTPMPSCPFQKVPLEVLLRITYFLKTPELGNVRLTCRSIEQSLYTTFTQEFFTRKQFMLSDVSLQALIDISKSRLGGHLRMVHFGLDRFPPTSQGQPSPEQDMKLIQRHAGMFTLWNSGYHRDMLAEAFGNLQNLEDVVIRDFNSNRRSRDGPYQQWTSYGSTTANRETGVRITQDSSHMWNTDFSHNFSSQIFAAVLMALGQAKARPKGIEVMARRGNPLKNFAFNIAPYMESSVMPVLQNLEKLHVDIDMTWRNGATGTGRARPPEAASYMIRNFLLNTTNLRHLRINELHSSESCLGGVLEWLAKPSSTSPSSPASTSTSLPTIPSPDFAQLEELNLGQMNAEASWILNVVRKLAPTLKRLEIWRVTLLRTLPDNHANGQLYVSFWTKFFERLRSIPGLDLRHIKAGHLDQQWRSRSSKSGVSFGGKETVVAYTGTDWKHFIGEVISRISVRYALDDGDISDGTGEEDDDYSDGIWDLYALDL